MFLPISKEDMTIRGWDQCDFIMVTGDAYVDHPSFGVAIISRYMESLGYKIGIIAQPNWRHTKDISRLGPPKYGFLVTAGNIDSMVNHYTVNKKRRHKDVYTPGGKSDRRPDRATIVYCNLIKQVYKDVPIIIGGIEASLRRMAHYDYWSNQVKRSIVLDSQADILVYGMGERTIGQIAEALAAGIDVKDLSYINGTVYSAKHLDHLVEPIILPTYDSIKKKPSAYAESFAIQYKHNNHTDKSSLVETYDEHLFVVQNPPSKPLEMVELDKLYDYPYMYQAHPTYEKEGGVEAINEIKYSITSNRGCFGGCHFCALAFHQGKIVQGRSHNSMIKEAKRMISQPDFKGYIHDVGGPTANFTGPACDKQFEHGTCTHKACMEDGICERLNVDHKDYVSVLRKLRSLDGVKKVFIRSGIRYDYLMKDSDKTFLKELVEHHISGQLRVAPEHVSDHVLKLMGKPSIKVYDDFRQAFNTMNKRVGKDQYLVPYFISSHPGSDIKDAVKLAEYIRDLGFQPDQVQDFYPTPGTISTCMYYTGLDPMTMEKVFVPKSNHEKAMQRALMQFRLPQNYKLVKEALIVAGREDLIGYDKRCLIRPEASRHGQQAGGYGKGHKQKASKSKGTVNKAKSNKSKKTGKKTIRNIHKKKK